MKLSIFKKANNLKVKVIELGSIRDITEFSFKIELEGCENCNSTGKVGENDCIVCEGRKVELKECPIVGIIQTKKGTSFRCTCKFHSIHSINRDMLCSYVLAVFYYLIEKNQER